jgi:hypothetical protein
MRGTWRVSQVGPLPDGSLHASEVGSASTHEGSRGVLRKAVELAADHYTTHRNRNGGYVGIAPTYFDGLPATAVQLHAPDGEIESWRLVVVRYF